MHLSSPTPSSNDRIGALNLPSHKTTILGFELPQTSQSTKIPGMTASRLVTELSNSLPLQQRRDRTRRLIIINVV
jgi:hypothetical protein